MYTYRFAYRLVSGLGRWFTIAVMVLVLSACGATGTGLPQTIPAKLPTGTVTPHSAPAATPTTTTLPDTAAWKTYQNDRAGYTVDYPADWIINEHIESDGADMTTFAPGPGNNGMGVSVIVRSGEPAAGEVPDMPNTRCQQVTVGELSGTRCFDTIAFSTTTTFVSQGRVYILASSGKRLDQNIYQRFLSSLTIKP